MDQLTLKLKPVHTAQKEVVEIYINGENLIEMVREVERPFAIAEGHPDLAGNYMNISSRILRPPSQHLFGKPEDEWFKYKGRVELLSCGSCGGSWCWPLSCRIEITNDEIIWRDFVQPHRDNPKSQAVWKYTCFGPFVFDRWQYTESVASIKVG